MPVTTQDSVMYKSHYSPVRKTDGLESNINILQCDALKDQKTKFIFGSKLCQVLLKVSYGISDWTSLKCN
jgi:hypothetical protein